MSNLARDRFIGCVNYVDPLLRVSLASAPSMLLSVPPP